MKFRCVIISMLLFAACLLCGCGGSVTGGEGRDVPAPVQSEQIDVNLRAFLGITESNIDGDRGDRTPSSESENYTAKWLVEHFADKTAYPALTVTPLKESPDQTEDKTRCFITYNEVARPSYNVEIRLANPGNGIGNDFRQVIIGTGYGNLYGNPAEGFEHQSSTGAMQSGTGAATLMSIIDYCSRNAETLFSQIDFDLVFVFFGSSGYNSLGAETYLKYMEPSERLGTLLMYNIGKMGGERLYLYSGEVQTDQERFLRDTASDWGLRYYTLPDNMPIIDGLYLDGVYYSHFAMLGDHAPFLEQDIPVASVFSGYYGGFNLSDLEGKKGANLGNTANDTYYNLTQKRAAYAAQGSDVATLLLAALLREDFADVMQQTRKTVSDYSFWTNPFWAYMIVIFAIVAFSVVLIVLVKYFEKKYPYLPPVRRMKIAVFGMEYETKTEGDIFVDIKRPKNPFDGY